MRRMYSEQELSKIIKEVFDAEVASGEFDETIADYVDAYLVEHPVDITALEGQDVELNSLDADGLITGGEIVEKMSGYNAYTYTTTGLTIEIIYAGVVKNGNKITFAVAFNIEASDDLEVDNGRIIQFQMPEAVASKLYPSTILGGNIIDSKNVSVFSAYTTSVDLVLYLDKGGTSLLSFWLAGLSGLTRDTPYFGRYEATFLLSDSLVS